MLWQSMTRRLGLWRCFGAWAGLFSPHFHFLDSFLSEDYCGWILSMSLSSPPVMLNDAMWCFLQIDAISTLGDRQIKKLLGHVWMKQKRQNQNSKQKAQFDQDWLHTNIMDAVINKKQKFTRWNKDWTDHNIKQNYSAWCFAFFCCCICVCGSTWRELFDCSFLHSNDACCWISLDLQNWRMLICRSCWYCSSWFGRRGRSSTGVGFCLFGCDWMFFLVCSCGRCWWWGGGWYWCCCCCSFFLDSTKRWTNLWSDKDIFEIYFADCCFSTKYECSFFCSYFVTTSFSIFKQIL